MNAAPVSERTNTPERWRRDWRVILVAVSVLVLAVALRVPPSFQSFWVDELHSAWCVWGDLAEVGERAAAGNQSPVYFWGLWLWRQCLGESEWGLRLSSILPVAASASLLSVGVARWSGSLIAGCLAGLILAVEAHSLYFSVELRPYSWVILASTVACCCLLRRPSDQPRAGLAWEGVGAATLAAFWVHPTAIASMGWLVVASGIRRVRTGHCRITKRDGWMVALFLGSGLFLWTQTLSSTWQGRSDWAVFARGRSLSHWAGLWNWTWLVIVPWGVVLARWVAAAASPRGRTRTDQPILSVAFLLSAIATGSTLIFWGASRLDWVHLFHRRYLVAVLPMLAVGASLAAAKNNAWGCRGFHDHWSVRLVIALVLIVGLMHSQRVLPAIASGDVAGISPRDEGWRSAIDVLNVDYPHVRQVYVDAGLIESRRFADSQPGELARADIDYLTFPVRGPYQLSGRELEMILPLIHKNQLAAIHASSSIAILTRRPPAQLMTDSQLENYVVHSAGNVHLLVRR